MWKRTQVDTGAQPNQRSDSNRIVRSIYDRFSLLYSDDDLTLLNTRVLRYCLEMFSLELDDVNVRRNFCAGFYISKSPSCLQDQNFESSLARPQWNQRSENNRKSVCYYTSTYNIATYSSALKPQCIMGVRLGTRIGTRTPRMWAKNIEIEVAKRGGRSRQIPRVPMVFAEILHSGSMQTSHFFSAVTCYYTESNARVATKEYLSSGV